MTGPHHQLLSENRTLSPGAVTLSTWLSEEGLSADPSSAAVLVFLSSQTVQLPDDKQNTLKLEKIESQRGIETFMMWRRFFHGLSGSEI